MTPPRISRIVLKGNRRPDQRRARNHLAFIRRLPCIVCGSRPAQAAHVRAGTDGGAGMKPSDKFTVPLCHDDHMRQHGGELSFWAALGIDPVDQANRLWTVSGDTEAGERIVFRAHQAINLRRTK
jgi:hypothetical protein